MRRDRYPTSLPSDATSDRRLNTALGNRELNKLAQQDGKQPTRARLCTAPIHDAPIKPPRVFQLRPLPTLISNNVLDVDFAVEQNMQNSAS